MNIQRIKRINSTHEQIIIISVKIDKLPKGAIDIFLAKSKQN